MLHIYSAYSNEVYMGNSTHAQYIHLTQLNDQQNLYLNFSKEIQCQNKSQTLF